MGFLSETGVPLTSQPPGVQVPLSKLSDLQRPPCRQGPPLAGTPLRSSKGTAFMECLLYPKPRESRFRRSQVSCAGSQRRLF